MEGFSVIMPVYNQGTFIRRAIISLCGQNYTEWELILINDGSTDQMEEYITDILQTTEYQIHYIINSENKGLGQHSTRD